MRWSVPLLLLWTAVAAAQPARSLRDPEVQAALDELKREPSVQDAQRAALEFYRVDPGTVDSMRSRAGWKSLLPALRVAGRHNGSTVDLNRIDRTMSVSPTDDTPTVIDKVDGTVNELSVEGTWDLPRLVFNAETLDVSSLAVLQENVLKEVTRLYYTRRRAQVDLILSPPDDAATRLTKEMRIEELTATLDAMTGNLFTRHAHKERGGARD
jgi:hypothetical protein